MMIPWRRVSVLVILLGLAAAFPGCRTAPRTAAAFNELRDQAFLFEVVRHLYRWYLDENDVEKLGDADRFVFWVRPLNPKLDPGDRSRLAEIVMPALGMNVLLKKSDYTIEELSVGVKSDGYKITNVARVDVPRRPPAGSIVVDVSFEEMKDYLFRTRDQCEFPDKALVERLRAAVRKEMKRAPALRPEEEPVAHVAPLSPVANELWVYMENSRRLVRFASDIDLANPAVWENETLAVRTYDILKQTVVSLRETGGSNAFMTRDQVGRALFNCVVLGRRMVLPRLPATEKAAP